MERALSKRVGRCEPSATLAVSATARRLRAAGQEIIDWSAGEPDFDTPENICDAAIQAIRDGQTRYTSVGGTPALRAAIRARQKIDLRYMSLASEESTRTVRPLQMEYWGRVWTLTAWCEMRDDFRVFRVDKIEELTVLPALFVDEAGKTLADYDLIIQQGDAKRAR